MTTTSPIRARAALHAHSREKSPERARDNDGYLLPEPVRSEFARQTFGMLSAIIMFLSVLGMVMVALNGLIGL